MKNTTISLDHPVLFVHDPSVADAEIPEHPDDLVVASTSTCLSIKAIAYVDGDVTVTILREGEDPPPKRLIKVFAGMIATPGLKAAVVTSNNKNIMDIDVKNEATEIKVSVDDVNFPSEIWIEAK